MKTIALTQGQVALVDDSLFDQLNAYKWFAHRKHGGLFYAARRLSRKVGGDVQYLHRLVWELTHGPIPDGMTVDHRNRNPLDDQIANLRIATQQEQMRNRGTQANNSSGFIGVSRFQNKWRADASINGSRVYLGIFADPFSAAWVRDQYVRQAYGDFAALSGLQDRRQRARESV